MVLSFDLASTIITSKFWKVWVVRSVRSLGRNFSSFKVGMMIEKNSLGLMEVF